MGFLSFWPFGRGAQPAIPQVSRPAGIPVLDAYPGPVVTAALLRRLGWPKPELWADALGATCIANGITTGRRLAPFLGTIGHESGQGERLVESLDYTPKRLLEVYPSHFTAEAAQDLGRTIGHPADQRRIAEAVYGGRYGNSKPGDGYAWRGRGLIQLTFFENYERIAKLLGLTPWELAARLEEPEGAAASAAAFWRLAGCNDLADAGDDRGIRRAVNGPACQGLAAVVALTNEARATLIAMGFAA